ncbi:membrane protein [Insulibacter thermoxylanivorax]|uniref:Glycerol-3-phosphate acyltransferase n=1 Tax=Insulibacter thermoxylanivorax TaxID=2749268 RepID=A0A916QED2_9BACL|nr:glycerol-3-phosphate acyltransferase [Insulibacter thermoxylanivorax]GFR39220.1 membrane protein [Insulibacter thermoxylanivorax]
MTIMITLVCFLIGSLMFSYWIGRMLKVDIRSIGDGNPGAANLWSAAGYRFGLLGVLFDFMKGYLPISIVVNSGLASGDQLIPVVLAPIAGHAFTPFLKFNGGKSLAVTFGVWSALTEFRASLAYALILAVLLLLTIAMKNGAMPTSDENGLMTTAGFVLMGIYLYYAGYPSYVIWIWLGNFLLLFWKNRVGIAQLIRAKLKDREEEYTHSA